MWSPALIVRQHIPLQLCQISARPHGNIFQKTVFFCKNVIAQQSVSLLLHYWMSCPPSPAHLCKLRYQWCSTTVHFEYFHLATRLTVLTVVGMFGLDEVLVILGNGQFVHVEKLAFCRFSVKVHFTLGYCLLGQELQKFVASVIYKIMNLSCNRSCYVFCHSWRWILYFGITKCRSDVFGGKCMALIFGSSLSHWPAIMS